MSGQPSERLNYPLTDLFDCFKHWFPSPSRSDFFPPSQTAKVTRQGAGENLARGICKDVI